MIMTPSGVRVADSVALLIRQTHVITETQTRHLMSA